MPCICGSLGYCTIQFVVEADGSVYPCDFYCLDQFKLGNILTNDINKMIFSKQALQFLNESKQSYPLCLKCRYRHICHGNCKRMNSCYINEKYCGLKEFMDKHEKDILLAIDIIYGNSRLNNNY